MCFTFGVTRLSYEDWVKKFCNHRTVWYGAKPRTQIFGTLGCNVPLLRSILSKVMLRRRKEDVLKDLPPLIYSEYTLEDIALPITFEYDKQKYRKEKHALEEALSYTTNDHDASKVMEAFANSVPTLRRVDGMKRAIQVAEIVAQELEDRAYQKKILFAWHREVIEILKERLNKYKPVVINGGVSNKVRQDAIDSFQNDPGTQIFIGQLISAGTAITLTAAHHVDLVEEDYTPGVNAQAIMRAHRRGQKFPVCVRFYALADTIGAKITRIHRRKAQELTAIYDVKGEENAINH